MRTVRGALQALGWRTSLASAALCLTVAVACTPVLIGAFGDSRDGINAGVWAGGSRALREDGPGASDLGATSRLRRPVTYVNHPPLIVVEAAATEALFGERPWASRLPALASTVAALLLVELLLVELGVGRGVAVLATALAFGAPMVRTYGAMLDTPVTGLAAGVAVLLIVERHVRRNTGIVALAAVGFVAACSSWLGLLTGAVAMIALAQARRPKGAAAVLAGSTAAVGLFLLWAGHALGQVSSLRDALVGKATTAPLTLPDTARAVLANHRSAFPVWVLLSAIPLAVLAVRRFGWRPLVLAWGPVVVWTIAFRDRAANHEYWTFWVVVPLALGAAAGSERLARAFASRHIERSLPVRALPVVAVGLAVVGLFLPSPGFRTWSDGTAAGRLLAGARLPADQEQIWVLTLTQDDLPWAAYAAQRPEAPLATEQVAFEAAKRPDDLVLTSIAAPGEAARPYHPAGSCLPAGSSDGAYAVVPLAALARCTA